MRSRASEHIIRILCACVLCFSGLPAFSQVEDSSMSLSISPDAGISSFYFTGAGFPISPGVRMAIALSPHALDILQFKGDIGYTLFLLSGSPFSLFDAGLGIGTRHAAGRLRFDWAIGGGTSFGLAEGGNFPSTFNPYISLETGLSFALSSKFSLGLKGFYRACFPFPAFQRFGTVFAATYHMPRRQRGVILPSAQLQLLEFSDVAFDSVFPVFRKYYDANPIGAATVINTGDAPANNINISLILPQYMDAPKSGGVIDSLAPGEEAEIPLYALFTDRILDITEDTLAAAEVTCEYSSGEAKGSEVQTVSVRIHDRNAMTWEDDRRVAAFVTRKDPAVLSFAKTVSGYVKDLAPAAINEQLIRAAAIYEALGVYGLHYEIDPSTPMSELHQNKTAIDFLQFPKQTFEYRAGDCDDLTILYTALLEALGIETAVITIPGHIFAAFLIDLSEDQIEDSRSGEYIFSEGRVWVPVEVTALEEGFCGAWRMGAKEWREASDTGHAAFYPLHLAWELYEPVQMPGDVNVTIPGQDLITGAFEEELVVLIQEEIKPLVNDLERRIAENPDSQVLRNKLGVLYGRYHLFDEAEKIFGVLTDNPPYVPAILNLGHVMSLKGQHERALEYYTQAYDLLPENPLVLVALAKANFNLKNYDGAQRAYEALQKVSPETAERYQHLATDAEGESRASDFSTEDVFWADE